MYWIWSRVFANEELVGESRSAKSYVRKGNAERVAERMYPPSDRIRYEWIVSEENPWSEKELTDSEIRNQALAEEIRDWLLKKEMWVDTTIFFNGKAYSTSDKKMKVFYYNDVNHLLEYEDDPAKYVEYFNHDTVTMIFEGPLYELINYDFRSKEKEEFDAIFKKHGMYYELGYAWSLACYEYEQR